VHCVEQDCFKPFRDDQLGRYDMVNVRFMLVLITPSNLEAFLENICSLLSEYRRSMARNAYHMAKIPHVSNPKARSTAHHTVVPWRAK
jgi:hypothetical protein